MANEYVNKVIYGGDTLIDLTGDTATAADVLTGKKFHLASGEQVTGTGPNLSTDTVTAADVKFGVTFHTKTGAASTGTAPLVPAADIYPSTTDRSIAAGSFVSGAQSIKAVTTSGITAANIKAGSVVKVGDAADDDRITAVTGTFTADATASAAEILKDKTAYKNGAKLTGTMPNNGAVTGNISTKAGQYTIPQGYHDGSGKVGIASAEQAKILAGNIKSGITILGVLGTYTGEAITTQNKEITPDASWTGDQVLTPDAGYDYLAQVTVHMIPYVETDNTAGGKTVQIGAVA